MTKTLFPHQIKAIDMMEERERTKTSRHPFFRIELTSSIYADITGFGKTLVVLGLICRNRMEWKPGEDYIHDFVTGFYGNGTIIKRSLLSLRPLYATLITASATIIKQWVDELKETTLSFITIFNRKSLKELDPNRYDVVLCALSFLNDLRDQFKGHCWKRVVFDEPMNRSCYKIQIIAGFTWFLTSAPQLLLKNSKHCLNGIFTPELDYTVYKNMIIKNDDHFVRQSFDLPSPEFKYYETFRPSYSIQNLLNPILKEMVATGNIEEAVRFLGGILTSGLHEFMEKEKKEALDRALSKRDKFERSGDMEKFHKWKEKCVQIQRELVELRERLDQLIACRCPICLEKKQQPILLTCCQNMFCGCCVLDWFYKNCSCPLCRKKITTAHLVFHNPTSHNVPQDPILPKKTEIILDLLHKKEDAKVLLFSSFPETFDEIREVLRENNLPFGEIKGTIGAREKTIHDFKNGDCKILFLNTYESCAGLNLQETTDIFFYHPTPEPLSSQIIGRAYRIGRTQPLTIHCF